MADGWEAIFVVWVCLFSLSLISITFIEAGVSVVRTVIFIGAVALMGSAAVTGGSAVGFAGWALVILLLLRAIMLAAVLFRARRRHVETRSG
jgi:hypothetical protein